MPSLPRPSLTIGMAHFQDYDGVYFTLQTLRANNDTEGVEFLVVDNSPGTLHSKDVRGFLNNVPNSRYIEFGDAVGTSAPRDRVFREATGDVVLCVDCHVVLWKGALDALRHWWATRPDDSRDMLTGPLMNDAGGPMATQYNDMWRAEMWGIWGQAWQCGCLRAGVTGVNPHAPPLIFTPFELPGNVLTYRTQDQQPVSECPRCGGELPSIGWAGHEAELLAQGYDCLALGDTPFEIPGMGLGLFAMRRNQWVGFHPLARGFGGEELYVHEKVRRDGGRVWCHPRVKWFHRFGRPGGVRYPIGRYSKTRNYVLEFQELGRPLDPIYDHFVASGLVSQAEWEHLLADPIGHVNSNASPPPPPPQHTAQHDPNQPPDGDHDLDTLFAWCAAKPRDLNEHAAKIRELASQALHVTAIVKRREWDVFLLAGRPDDLVVWTTEPDTLHDTLHRVVVATETNPRAARRIKHYTTHRLHPAPDEQIAETDLLVLDTVHHADHLYAELTRYHRRVRRRILIRGSGAFAEIAEGGNGPGVLAGLRRFMVEFPEWSVIYHTRDQYGITVISRDKADKPKLPSIVQMAKNFAGAVVEHVKDGAKAASQEEFEERLRICSICEFRNGDRCSICGCGIKAKAAWRSSQCPIGKWPILKDTPPPPTETTTA